MCFSFLGFVLFCLLFLPGFFWIRSIKGIQDTRSGSDQNNKRTFIMGNAGGIMGDVYDDSPGQDYIDPSTISTDPQSELLHNAIKAGDLIQVEQLISNNPSIIHAIRREPFDDTISTTNSVILASERGYNDILRVLCENGASSSDELKKLVTSKNSHGVTSLMFACMGSHIETMEYLFANGATEDVCRPDNHWMTCVHEAATNGNLDVLMWCLDRGAATCIRWPNKLSGNTPLLTAIEKNHLDIAKILFANGASADISIPDNLGRRPLHMACRVDTLRWLYKNGAAGDLNIESKKSSDQDKQQKAQDDRLEKLQKKLKKNMRADLMFDFESMMEKMKNENIDKDIKIEAMKSTTTPLGYKTEMKNVLDGDVTVYDANYLPVDEKRIGANAEQLQECIDQLIAWGGKLNEPMTPMIDMEFLLASKAGDLNTMKRLFKNGANLLVVHPQNRWSCMWMAASDENIGICNWLYKNGGESLVTLAAAEGITPVHIAAQYGKVKSLQWLFDHGADLHRRNTKLGHDGACLATTHGHLDALMFFYHNGCQKSVLAVGPGPYITPMEEAKRYGVKKIVRRLHKLGVPYPKQEKEKEMYSDTFGTFNRMTKRKHSTSGVGQNQKNLNQHDQVEEYEARSTCAYCKKQATYIDGVKKKMMKCSKCTTYYCDKTCKRYISIHCS